MKQPTVLDLTIYGEIQDIAYKLSTVWPALPQLVQGFDEGDVENAWIAYSYAKDWVKEIEKNHPDIDPPICRRYGGGDVTYELPNGYVITCRPDGEGDSVFYSGKFHINFADNNPYGDYHVAAQVMEALGFFKRRRNNEQHEV